MIHIQGTRSKIWLFQYTPALDFMEYSTGQGFWNGSEVLCNSDDVFACLGGRQYSN